MEVDSSARVINGVQKKSEVALLLLLYYDTHASCDFGLDLDWIMQLVHASSLITGQYEIIVSIVTELAEILSEW